MQQKSSDTILKYIIHFVLLILIQAIILNSLSSKLGLPEIHIYLLFILILPFGIHSFNLMIIAFIYGLIIDSFESSYGIHAATAIFIAVLKPYVAMLFTNRIDVDRKQAKKISIIDLDMLWLLKFFILIFILHFLFYYFYEAFEFKNSLTIIVKSFYSIILSVIISFLYISLFRKK